MAVIRTLSHQTLSFLVTDTAPLGKRDALLAIVAACGAAGAGKATEEAVRFAFKEGIGEPTVREVFRALVGYCGFPTAASALAAIQRARGEVIDPLEALMRPRESRAEPQSVEVKPRPPGCQEAGRSQAEAILGLEAKALQGRLTRADPLLAQWVECDFFGQVQNDPELAPRERLVVGIAACVVSSAGPYLRDHVAALARQADSPEMVWKLYHILGRLFDRGDAPRGAHAVFEDVLGREPSDYDPSKDPYRWD